MIFDKVKVRIEGRAVIEPGTTIDSLTECNSMLMLQMCMCPGDTQWLLGVNTGSDHFLAAPIMTCGGLKKIKPEVRPDMKGLCKIAPGYTISNII